MIRPWEQAPPLVEWWLEEADAVAAQHELRVSLHLARRWAWVLALHECGQPLGAACRALGATPRSAYVWASLYKPVWPILRDRAKHARSEAINAEVKRRAVDGVSHAVWYGGRRVGEETGHSDHLLDLLARRVDPRWKGEAYVTAHRPEPAGYRVSISPEVQRAAGKLAATLDALPADSADLG